MSHLALSFFGHHITFLNTLLHSFSNIHLPGNNLLDLKTTKQIISTYEEALEKIDLQQLDERQRELCLKFVKKCLKIEKVKISSQLKKDQMK